jgi:hypothetical protein
MFKASSSTGGAGSEDAFHGEGTVEHPETILLYFFYS